MADTGDGTLHSAVLRANSKSFFLDLKSNARGRYLKIAEKGRYRAKSSIVVPSSGLSPLIATFRYYIDEDAAGRRHNLGLGRALGHFDAAACCFGPGVLGLLALHRSSRALWLLAVGASR
ncbi:uncharacterized protein HaLaN_20934, partial [Haematococcus lacustris]